MQPGFGRTITRPQAIPPSIALQPISEYLSRAFHEGRKFTKILPDQKTAFFKDYKIELQQEILNPPELAKLGGSRQALKAMFLFAAIIDPLRLQGHHVPQRYNNVYRASVYCQQFLTRAFISLPANARIELIKSPWLPDYLVRDWQRCSVGAFTVARVAYQLLKLGTAPRLSHWLDDMNGIDLFCFPALVEGLCFQIKTLPSSKSSWYALSPVQNSASGIEKTSVDSFFASARNLNRTSRRNLVPVFLAVQHNHLVIQSMDADPLHSFLDNLLTGSGFQ